MRKLRIAQVAPPLERVPPMTYGGTERVVSVITEELVRRGHDVTLFASGDSITSARLVPVVEQALWRNATVDQDFLPFWAITLGRLASAIGEFDVVHNHLDFLAYPLSRLAPCPVLTTLHGRLDLPGLDVLYREFADVPLVSISNAQRRPIPHANWLATVYHGIDLTEFRPRARAGKYLAYLGRISPEKGLDTAIRVAWRAGLPLKIGSRPPLPYANDPNVRTDRAYYEHVVEPLLDTASIEILGELDRAGRDALLGGAAALLFPITWPEPFGLVMPEALACGTPVIALRAGSVPEVIEPGVTGFICSDEDELVDAVRHLPEIDRLRCRHEAERRFSPEAMTDGYERAYEQLMRGGPRSATALQVPTQPAHANGHLHRALPTAADVETVGSE
jgi:glycosyltransferase involved in cell wall biosynthesis